jgi:hypothetical protein
MSSSTYFSQECPTCGRKLRIHVEYLGKLLVCQHCQGKLHASDPASVSIDEANDSSTILKRADELLASVDHRAQSHTSHTG